MCTERKSLTKECGWKDGDRGGLAEWQQTHGKKKVEVCLDINRPSHGRSCPKSLLGSQGSSVPPPFSVEGDTASVDRQFDIGRMAETGRGAGHGDDEGSLRCAVLRWRERRVSRT
jgi:hypothetical protein